MRLALLELKVLQPHLCRIAELQKMSLKVKYPYCLEEFQDQKYRCSQRTFFCPPSDEIEAIRIPSLSEKLYCYLNPMLLRLH